MRTLGRKGAGPGEYSQANGLAFLPDGRLALWDPPTSRISIYDSAGGTTTWEPPVTGLWMNNALSPAAPHAFALRAPLRDTTAEGRERDVARREAYFLYDLAGTVSDTLVLPPDRDRGERLVAQSKTMMSVYGVPFVPGSASAMLADARLATAEGDVYRIELSGGPQPLRIEREVTAVPVQDGEASEQRARAEFNMRRVDPAWSWNGPAIPSIKPLLQQLFATHDGRLWVQVSAPGERIPEAERDEPAPAEPGAPPPPPAMTWREPAWYDVYERDGTLLGRVVLPPRSTLLGANGDLVWGVSRDELDVPYLTQWRLEPSMEPSMGVGPAVPR